MKRLPSSLQDLIAHARQKIVAKNQVLIYQDDTTSEVYYLRSGIVKVYDIDDAGNEKILHLFRAPAFLPLAAFGGAEAETRWFYSALTDCELSEIPHTEIEKLMEHDSDAALFLIRWFSTEVHEIMTRLNSMSKTQTRDKVIAALKYLATYHVHATRGPWYKVTFPVTHQLLADLTGVSRECVTHCLRDLHDDRLIKMTSLSTLQINRAKLFKQ